MFEKPPLAQRRISEEESLGLFAGVVQEAMRKYGPTTREQARRISSDEDLLNRTTLEIALAVAAASATPFDVAELKAYVRDCLLDAASMYDRPSEAHEYDKVIGIEKAESSARVSISLHLGYGWKAVNCERNAFITPSLLAPHVAIANVLEELPVQPNDRRLLTDRLLPVVHLGKNGYSFMARQGEDLVDLYAGDSRNDRKYVLSDVLTKRRIQWGETPVYSKEELAIFLEAVLHSGMQQDQKNAFVDQLMSVEEYSGEFERYRPAYEGGPYYVHQSGKRITFATGESMRLVYGERRRDGSFSYMGSGLKEMDAVFIFALVERGALPAKALDALYTVRVSEYGLELQTPHPGSQLLRIKLTEPYQQDAAFPAVYLAMALSRDPRIPAEVRIRLHQLLRHRMQVRVTDIDERAE